MKFIARLRNYETGNIYHGEFNVSSFETAWETARREFPKHKVITIYPNNHIARLEWAARGETDSDPCQKCQQLEARIDQLDREVLGLQISLDDVTRQRNMLLRQLNQEEVSEP